MQSETSRNDGMSAPANLRAASDMQSIPTIYQPNAFSTSSSTSPIARMALLTLLFFIIFLCFLRGAAIMLSAAPAAIPTPTAFIMFFVSIFVVLLSDLS